MEQPSLLDRYQASMLLSGTGDALGFKNGGWEFCFDGKIIHEQLKKLGGLKKINVSLPKWKLSDDTIMHIATAEGLVEKSCSADKEELYLKIAERYKECMKDMFGRSAGATCSTVSWSLKPNVAGGHHVPFNSRGGGCGAAMRAMCIGLRYPYPEQLDELIAVAVEAGRMTHHHPTGYLGSLASALFTSYAIQGIPVKSWGHRLMLTLPKAKAYVESQGRYVKENIENWSYFTDHWHDYLKERGLLDGESDPKFPSKYDVTYRDSFYKSLSYGGWGGASGHDAPIIAYDGLLAAGSDWDKLCKHAMFHGGDSDSTGVVAGACFGAMYGFQGVPANNYENLEYKDRITNLAVQLYKLSHHKEEDLVQCLPEVPSDEPAGLETGDGEQIVSHEHIQVQVAETASSSQSQNQESSDTAMVEAEKTAEPKLETISSESTKEATFGESNVTTQNLTSGCELDKTANTGVESSVTDATNLPEQPVTNPGANTGDNHVEPAAKLPKST